MKFWCLIERQSYGTQKTLALKPGRPGFAESTVFQLHATKHSLRGFGGIVRGRKNGDISFLFLCLHLHLRNHEQLLVDFGIHFSKTIKIRK